jgi:hypothetical protein
VKKIPTPNRSSSIQRLPALPVVFFHFNPRKI